jgi:hypothetical protein
MAKNPKAPIDDFDKHTDHTLSAKGQDKINAKKSASICVFYDDPSAAQLMDKMDKFCNDYLDSKYDETHVFHKTIEKGNTLEFFAGIMEFLKFRASKDWAKYKYYNPQINSDEGSIGYADQPIPVYE